MLRVGSRTFYNYEISFRSRISLNIIICHLSYVLRYSIPDDVKGYNTATIRQYNMIICDAFGFDIKNK